ncbi:proteasome activator complex subunit 3 [Culicoides brevitarsis]|uniref:proteasome activator complex subunit 3 n=1 Tax=Culicoides brevitarsis TaxID=469753 RepID=UPI00307C19D1
MADAKAVSEKVQAYKNDLIKKAENLIVIEFPQKIVKLNELLETSRFAKDKNMKCVKQDLNIPVPDPILLCDGDGNSCEPPAKRTRVATDTVTGTKVMALPNGLVKCNTFITDLIEIVKPIIQELVEDSNVLKMWISFLIPKVEDGNNFGVSIQEDTLAEIQSVESEAAAFFDQISRYFISRAKVVSKVAKYPHIADYRRAVQELDEKEFLSLWLVTSEVRNRYCSLHDIVIKNMEKLKKPRSSNAESLY